MSTCLVLITLLCCDVCTVEVWRPGWMSQYPGESPHLITTLREAADWGREAVTWPGRTSSHLVQPPVCIRCAALLTPRTTTLSTSLRNFLFFYKVFFVLVLVFVLTIEAVFSVAALPSKWLETWVFSWCFLSPHLSVTGLSKMLNCCLFLSKVLTVDPAFEVLTWCLHWPAVTTWPPPDVTRPLTDYFSTVNNK